MAAGAQMVKLEGGCRHGRDDALPQHARHPGSVPTSASRRNRYTSSAATGSQGKDDPGAARLLADALAQQEAGASLIVLEAIPEALAAATTARLAHPDDRHRCQPRMLGQVLVLHDMLDISSGRKARFVRNFMAGQPSIAGALAAYVAAVKNGSFPGPEHCY
jgi:3-methyl-2-oxobutanoate hydroxymethyltransferase